jgi:hypothetical protein
LTGQARISLSSANEGQEVVARQIALTYAVGEQTPPVQKEWCAGLVVAVADRRHDLA